MRFTILHTNDMHGRVEGIARVATVVDRVRAATSWPVVYLDAGDVEETTTRISNITKGAAMHRLLTAAGCEAHTVGNAAWLRYGTEILAEHAEVAGYPLLLANLRRRDGRELAGVRSSIVLDRSGIHIGLIGVTASFDEFHDSFDFGVRVLGVENLVRDLALELRRRGADPVIVLSHLGLDVPEATIDDRRLARAVGAEVDAIIGGHSHDLLPEGERIGDVLVAQAGDYARHVGRIDSGEDGVRASTIPVPEEEPLHPGVLAEVARIEQEAAAMLDTVIGELGSPLDQLGAAAWLADILRQRMGAEVALVTPGQAFSAGLCAGPLLRAALWDVCDSSANPGSTTMTGAQLKRVIELGRDPDFTGSSSRTLRGRSRGRLQVSGLQDTVHPERVYTVAGTDWELEPYGGMVEPSWGLEVRYDFPTIVREAIEDYLGDCSAAAGARSKPAQ